MIRWFAIAGLGVAGSLFGQGSIDVPEKVQVPILAKSLAYDSKLSGGNLLVLARNDNSGNQAEASSQFSGKPVKSFSVQTFDGVYTGKESLLGAIDALGVNMIYLCNDLTKPQLNQISLICSERDILTLTGVSQSVRDGVASLSVSSVGDKPKIILNRSKMREEGHFFSSSFLQLCQIVD